MKVDVDGSVSEGMGTGGWGFMIPLLVLVLVGWATMVVQFTFFLPLATGERRIEADLDPAVDCAFSSPPVAGLASESVGNQQIDGGRASLSLVS
jgi:hypothetical protein